MANLILLSGDVMFIFREMRKKTSLKVCVDESAKQLFCKITYQMPYLEIKDDVIMALTFCRCVAYSKR
jgi:hypothetical protein